MKQRLKLSPHWKRKLAELPETGMGHQLVDLALSDGRHFRNMTVYNGTELETDEFFDTSLIAEINLHQEENG